MPRKTKRAPAVWPEWKTRMVTPEERASVFMSRIVRAQAGALGAYAKYQVNLDYLVGMGALTVDENGNIDADVPESGFSHTINRLLGALASKRASITYTQPWIKVRERSTVPQVSPEERSATEYLLNYFLQRPGLELDTELRLGAMSLMIAYMAFKVWHKPFDEDEKPRRGELVGRIDKATGQIKVDVRGGKPRLDEEGELVGPEVEASGRITVEIDDAWPVEEHFGLEWVDWRNLFFDPEGGPTLKKHLYLCEREILRLDKFMDDEEFSDFTNKDGVERVAHPVHEVMDQSREAAMRLAAGGRRLWSPLLMGPAIPYQERDQNAQKDDLRVVLWTYYDLENKTTENLIEGHPKTVTPKKNEVPGWAQPLPFVFGRIHPTAGSWYPPTDVENYLPTAKMYDEASNMKLSHMRRSLRKYWILPDAMDDDQKEMFRTPYDGMLIESTDEPKPVADPDVNPGIYLDMNRFKIDGSEILADTPESIQGDDPTATEVFASTKKSGLRIAEIAKVFRNTFLQGCRLVLNALEANFPTEAAIAIVGPDGAFWSQKLNDTDITADVDLDLGIRELGPPDSNTLLRRMNELAAVAGPGIFQSRRWVERIVRELVGEDPELVNEIIAIYKMQAEAAAAPPPGATLGPEPRPSRAQNGNGAGAGAGPQGGRQMARLERVQR